MDSRCLSWLRGREWQRMPGASMGAWGPKADGRGSQAEEEGNRGGEGGVLIRQGGRAPLPARKSQEACQLLTNPGPEGPG